MTSSATTYGDVDVLGTTLHYAEVGAADGVRAPVLFLHGNPTSSHLWRHALALLAGSRRCVALDLVGMGGSGKPDLDYRLDDHVRYVDAAVEALGLQRAVLVGHDWGAVIAMDRLRRFSTQVPALAVMEAHLRPLADWDAFDEGGREIFRALRTPGTGEDMVLRDNFFLDVLLPAGIVAELAPEDLEAYRSPYPDESSRRPLLRWAREIPIAGEPTDVAEPLGAAAEHMASSAAPKLLLHGSPGALVTDDVVRRCVAEWPSLTTVDVGGPAGHFLPEDRPLAVAEALRDWLAELP